MFNNCLIFIIKFLIEIFKLKIKMIFSFNYDNNNNLF